MKPEKLGHPETALEVSCEGGSSTDSSTQLDRASYNFARSGLLRGKFQAEKWHNQSPHLIDLPNLWLQVRRSSAHGCGKIGLNGKAGNLFVFVNGNEHGEINSFSMFRLQSGPNQSAFPSPNISIAVFSNGLIAARKVLPGHPCDGIRKQHSCNLFNTVCGHSLDP